MAFFKGKVEIESEAEFNAEQGIGPRGKKVRHKSRYRTPHQTPTASMDEDDPMSPRRGHHHRHGQRNWEDERKQQRKAHFTPVQWASESRLNKRSRSKKKTKRNAKKGQRSRTRSIDINIRIPKQPACDETPAKEARLYSTWDAGYHPSASSSSSSPASGDWCSNSESGDQPCHHQQYVPVENCPVTSGAESFSSKFATRFAADREECQNQTGPKFSEVEVKVSRFMDGGYQGKMEMSSQSLPRDRGPPPVPSRSHRSEEGTSSPRHTDTHDTLELHHRGHIEGTDDGFPFHETASGSLKISRNQVSLQSRNVALLLANPEQMSVRNIKETHKPAVGNKPMIHPVNQLDESELAPPPLPRDPSPHQGSLLDEEIPLVQTTSSSIPVVDRGYETEPIFPSDPYGGRESKGSKTLMENMHYRVKKAINPDTKVVIGSAEFPVHGIALQCYSKLVDKQRRSKNQIMEVHIPEDVMSSQDFPSLMDWILMDENQKRNVIDRENVVGLFSGATFLGISQLRDDAYHFIQNHVEDGDPTILNMYEEARDRHCPELVTLLASKLAGLFPKIYKNRQFLRMSPRELTLVLSADNIVIKSELDVYDAAARWLLFDWDRRKRYTVDMMKNVRFGLLTPLQLTQIRHSAEAASLPNYQEIFAFPEVKKLVDDGQTFAILKDSYQGRPGELQRWIKAAHVEAPQQRRNIRTMPDPQQTLGHAHHELRVQVQSETKRKEHKKKKSTSNNISQEVLDQVATRLGERPVSQNTESPPRHHRRYSHQEAVEEELQGPSSFNPPKSELRLEEEEEAATLIQTAYRGLIARRNFRKLKEAARVAQAVFRVSRKKIPIKPIGPPGRDAERILVIGGYDSNRPHDTSSNSSTSIFQLDSAKNIWKLRGHLPEPRARQGSVQIDRFIYIFGGEDRSIQTSRGRNTPMATTWSLDLVTSTWFKMADMGTPRSYFGYVLARGKIYIFGGLDQEGRALDSCEVYNPRDNVWNPLPSMDGPRVSPGVAKSGEKIWIVGGFTKIHGNPMLNSTIQYDLNENRFYRGPSLPIAWCNGSLIAYYDQLILLGGATYVWGKGEIRSLSDVFHLANGQWVTAGTLKTGPRHGHCAVRIGKYVLLLGGINSETMAPMDQVESYNVEKFRGSTKVTNLPLKLSGPSGVVVVVR